MASRLSYAAAMVYQFGCFALDPDRFELRAEDKPVPVEPQVLWLLLALVQRRGRLVTKQQLVDAVWAGRPVADATLANHEETFFSRAEIATDGNYHASRAAQQRIRQQRFSFGVLAFGFYQRKEQLSVALVQNV